MKVAPLMIPLILLSACTGNATQEMEAADQKAAVAADTLTPTCSDAVSCDALFERALKWSAERPDRQLLNVKREKGRFLLVRGNGTALAVELVRNSDGTGWLKSDVVCTNLWKSACTPIANAARAEFGAALQ